MAFGIAELGLRAHLDSRMMADPDGNRAGLALRPEFLQIDHVVGCFEHVAAHQPRPAHPQPLDAHIVDAGIGIVGHDMTAGDVMPRIAFVLAEGGKGQQVGGVALIDDIADRCVCRVDDDRIDRL